MDYQRMKFIKKSPVRIFGRYLLIATASISCLACVQFLVLNHMPGWEPSINGMSNQRMINFKVIGDGTLAVAEFYAFESATQDRIDLSLSIMDLERGVKRLEVREDGLFCARISPSAKSLALGYRDGFLKIRMLEGSSPDLELRHTSNGRPIRDVHWSPDESRLLLSFDTSNEIVDLTGTVLNSISSPNIAPVVCPPNSNYFCLANQGFYKLYDWHDGREVAELPIESSVRSLAFSDEFRFVACLRGCDLFVFDLIAWKSVWARQIKAPWSTKTAIAFSPDNRSIALVLHGQSMKSHKVDLFDIESEKEISSHELGMDYIAGIEFSNERLWAWTTSGKVCNLRCKPQVADSKFTVLHENIVAFQ